MTGKPLFSKKSVFTNTFELSQKYFKPINITLYIHIYQIFNFVS